LRPQTPLTEAFAPTMLLGLAIQRTAQGLGVPAGLKWPNDVLVGGRKLAGILAEGTTRAGFLDYVVMGFGLNVSFDPAALGLGDRATSLQIELGGGGPGSRRRAGPHPARSREALPRLAGRGLCRAVE
jgi:BirA family biotin operon repressor/biotin-[acetyl-CoA-carboxylase] ligase